MEKEHSFNTKNSPPQFNFESFSNAFQTDPNLQNNAVEQYSQFDSARSSLVSSHSSKMLPKIVQRSSYMNSPYTSSYNTTTDSPLKLQMPIMNHHFIKENIPISGNPMPMTSALPILSTDPGFAAQLSCFGSHSFNEKKSPIGMNNAEFQYRDCSLFKENEKLPRVSSSPLLDADGSPIITNNYYQMNVRSGKGSNEQHSVFEQNLIQDSGLQTPLELGSRKRKGKARAKVAEEDENFETRKRSKMTSGDESGGIKEEEETNIAAENKKQDDNNQKPSEAPKDYIHVRARRGQATDSHSLAERVRREKIGERMKLLQDLVPGCNKVTGKAVMLDEIINYVQSLQCQVEFLSMKLSTVNSRQNVSMFNLLPKNMFQPNGRLSNQMYSGESSASGYHDQQIRQVCDDSLQPLDVTLQHNLGLRLDGFGDGPSQFPAFSEDDLQSLVQTGYAPNQTST